MIRRYLLTFAWIAFAIVPKALSQTASQSQADSAPASVPRPAQIAVEIKVVRFADEMLKELANTGKPGSILKVENGSPIIGATAILGDIQVFMLMEFLQSDERTETVHAAKLTVANGQKASVVATEERYFVTGVTARKRGDQVFFVPHSEKKELGFKATVRAVASADRRFVQVELDAKRVQLESANAPFISIQVPSPQLFDAPNGQGFTAAPAPAPIVPMLVQQPKFSTQTLEQRMILADGATCLIVAGTENRTVKNSTDARTVLYFVTPRIVIEEEIEREILGNQPAPAAPRRENQLAQPGRAAAVYPSPVRAAEHQEPVDTPAGPLPADLNVPIKASSFDAPGAGVSDLDRLQGVWSLVHSQCSRGDGVEENTYFLVDGKRAAFQCATGASQGGLYLDSAGKTKTFDFATSQWTREAIYVLEGDVLLMCYDSKTSAERPADFTINPRGSRVLLVFKRTAIPSSIRLPDGGRTFPTLTGQRPRVPTAPVPATTWGPR